VIAGKVLRADTGAPLADVEVKLLADSGRSRACTSETDGTFRFDHLDAGAYDVVIDAWGMVARGVVAEPRTGAIVDVPSFGGNRSVLRGSCSTTRARPRRARPLRWVVKGRLSAKRPPLMMGPSRFAGLNHGKLSAHRSGHSPWRGSRWMGGCQDTEADHSRSIGVPVRMTTQRLLPEDGNRRPAHFLRVVSDQAGNPGQWHPGRDVLVQCRTGNRISRSAHGARSVQAGRKPMTSCTRQGSSACKWLQGDWPSDAAADNLTPPTCPAVKARPSPTRSTSACRAARRTRRAWMVSWQEHNPGTVLTLVGEALRRGGSAGG